MKRAGTRRLAWAVLIASAPASATDAATTANAAPVFSISGRLNMGSAWRLEAPDPRLPFALNGAAAGVAAVNGTGANVDDGNLNFRRHQAVSRAATALLDLRASLAGTRARVELHAWHDFALIDGRRSWGNVANGYAAGQPLSDAGAPPLSRFAGAVINEAWVEQSVTAGRWRLLARAGQQTLDWGSNAGFGGGLEVLAPRDVPGARRAGATATAAEARVAVPGLFASATVAGQWSLEGYVQTHFRPNASEMCGSFGAVTDYLVEGCDKVMSGAPAVDDRRRLALGAYLKRLPTPRPDAGQFGIGARWFSPAGQWQLGAWHARYTSRVAAPGVRKSLRGALSPAFIAGDPDGANLAFFTEYPQAIRLDALTFAHASGAWGELSYRPNMPLLFGPGDALPPFLNASAPSLLRADANALPPGGILHGYERYPMLQAQLGLRRGLAGGFFNWSAEVVAKHIAGLPDQALRRYGRADVFGTGPVNGVCNVNMSEPALQCSLRGYVSRNALAARARVEARLPAAIDGLRTTLALGYVRDLRGWSADALINEGRNSATVSLRFDYRQRYFGELAWLPVWGGDYNATADRDLLALSAGVRF